MQKSKEYDYEISATYFPGTGEVEITYEQLFGNHEKVSLTLPVTPEQGVALAKVITPCVYHRARLSGEGRGAKPTAPALTCKWTSPRFDTVLATNAPDGFRFIITDISRNVAIASVCSADDHSLTPILRFEGSKEECMAKCDEWLSLIASEGGLAKDECVSFEQGREGRAQYGGELKNPYSLEETLKRLCDVLTAGVGPSPQDALELLGKAIGRAQEDVTYLYEMEKALLRGSTVEVRELFSVFGDYFAPPRDRFPYYPHTDAVNTIDLALHIIKFNAVNPGTLLGYIGPTICSD